MLALQLYRDSLCPNCSGNLHVTAAAENEDRFRAEEPLQCFRCVGIARSHDAYRKEKHSHTLLHLVPHEPNVK